MGDPQFLALLDPQYILLRVFPVIIPSSRHRGSVAMSESDDLAPVGEFRISTQLLRMKKTQHARFRSEIGKRK